MGSFLTVGSAQLGRKEAVILAGNRAGEDYATRIIPYFLRVSRYYYLRGDGSFSVATRMARAGDWGGAANIWREATNSHSGKVAGRACYNMAIISEINGDLDGPSNGRERHMKCIGPRMRLILSISCNKGNPMMLSLEARPDLQANVSPLPSINFLSSAFVAIMLGIFTLLNGVLLFAVIKAGKCKYIEFSAFLQE